MIASLRRVLALGVMILATAVMAPMQVLVLKSGMVDPGRLPRLWHRILVKAIGLRIHAHGSLIEKRPLLVACNHVSWTDIMVLGSLVDVTFIAKADLAGWPVFGFLAGLQRTLFVERERRGRAGTQAGEIAGRLAGNEAVVLFAEGSTGDGNHLLPCKSTLFGAARMALSGAGATVYIQPVAIAYTKLHGMPMGRQHRQLAAWIGDSELVPHLFSLIGEGAIDVEVRFGAARAFTAESDRKLVARQVEQDVRRMLWAALSARPDLG